MPILGIIASSAAANQSSFESIATVTAAGGETSFNFASIPQTYKSLQLRGIIKTSGTISSIDSTFYIQFNSDTGTNYSYHRLTGNGTSATAAGSASQSQIYIDKGAPTNFSGTTNMFGANIIDIIDYASTSKYKTLKHFGGSNINVNDTDYGVSLDSGLWMSTSAINEITIYTLNGTQIAGSSFALYGIKG